MRQLHEACFLLGLAALCVGCQSLVGDYEADLGEEPGTEPPLSSSHLCEIERSRFTFGIDLESTEQQPDLESYYERANPELIDHLSSLAQDYGDGLEHAGVTYIMGAPGVGKSFAIRNVLDGFDETQKCEIGLSDLFGEDSAALDFATAPAPDLATADGAIVFNSLPAITDLTEFSLEALLTAAGCLADEVWPPLIVIDDLDEVHDTTSTAILEAVDNYILDGAAGAGPFIHIIVVGRPGGFGTWLTDTERNEQNAAILDTFQLNAPRYETGGDLEFRLRGYLEFSELLADVEASGELDDYVTSFATAVSTYPFLTYSIGNLAVGNVVIEHTFPGLHEDEAELKAGLFDDILVRNSQSHGRPGAGSEYEREYLRLLEDVAARYADVNEAGLFTVRSEDTVEVVNQAGDVLGEVRVRDLLNRGGVAFLTSAVATTTRYRFEPFWLHPHLIERRNQRLDPDYEYRTCE